MTTRDGEQHAILSVDILVARCGPSSGVAPLRSLCSSRPMRCRRCSSLGGPLGMTRGMSVAFAGVRWRAQTESTPRRPPTTPSTTTRDGKRSAISTVGIESAQRSPLSGVAPVSCLRLDRCGAAGVRRDRPLGMSVGVECTGAHPRILLVVGLTTEDLFRSRVGHHAERNTHAPPLPLPRLARALVELKRRCRQLCTLDRLSCCLSLLVTHVERSLRCALRYDSSWLFVPHVVRLVT